MKHSENVFIRSDNFWIENNQAWFVSTKYNIILNLDLHTNICDYVVAIPNIGSNMFRLTPRCIKCGANIVCMPDKGDKIWIYDLENKRFSVIEINNPNKIRLAIWYFWEYCNKVYAISKGLKQIFEINVVEKKIDNVYLLHKEYGKDGRNNINSMQNSLACYVRESYVGGVVSSIKVGNVIYSLTVDNLIYQFNIETKKIVFEALPDIGRRFYTFCFDGVKFWLSGWYKELYIWDGKSMTILNEFPQGFGEYKFENYVDQNVDLLSVEYNLPIFEYLIALGENVWFIPCATNKLLYANRNDYVLKEFVIEEESETKESWVDRDDTAKYVLEYVKENRYIGLYSFKNKRILEIDTEMLSYSWCNYYFSESCLNSCAMALGNVFREKNAFEKNIYKTIIKSKSYTTTDENKIDFGSYIYSKIM